MTYYLNGTSAITSITSIATPTTIGGITNGFHIESFNVGAETEGISLFGFFSGFGVGTEWSYANNDDARRPIMVRFQVIARRLYFQVSDEDYDFVTIANFNVGVNLPDMTVALWTVSQDLTGTPGFIPLIVNPNQVIGIYGSSKSAFTSEKLTLRVNPNDAAGQIAMMPRALNVAGSVINAVPTLLNYSEIDGSEVARMTETVNNKVIKDVITSAGFVTR